MSTATAQVFKLPEREFQQAIAEMLGRGEYRRVLDAVRFARERDPKNIFLIALDRQVRRLEEMLSTNDPEVDERTKIEESLSQLIQRAWADATTRGVVLTLPADVAPAAESQRTEPALPPVAQPAQVPARHDASPVAVPTPSRDPARKISASTIAAAVLTLLVIGMAVTYFSTRKSQLPGQVTLLAKQPAAEVPPAAIAEPAPAPRIETPASTETAAPASTARQRSRAAKPIHESGQGTTPAENSSPKSLPPSEPRASKTTDQQAVAGLVPPPVRDAAAGAQPETETAEPFIPVQREPRVLKLVEPELGDATIGRAKDGEVVARVLIGTDGRAMKVRIVKSTNTFLNKPVAEALLKSQFEPGVMTAGPVQSWLTVPFRFR
jgi:protein TonB